MAEPHAQRPHRVVVVGGMGAVGHMFARLFAGSGAQVCIIDTSPATAGPPGVRSVRADIKAMDPQVAGEIAEADMVLLAVAEPVALAAVGSIAAHMRRDALLADTLSVKSGIVAQMRASAEDLQAVSLNPMFAPGLGIRGRPVAVVTVHDGPRVADLVRLLGEWGGRAVIVSADEHDRLANAAQALTHAAVLAFGLALSELDVDVADLTALAPPPHATLLALLARIASGTPEVYWDVQSANPQAVRARAALRNGTRRLADLVDADDEAGFTAMLDQLRGLFGTGLDHHRRLCERLFRELADPEDG